MGETPKPEESLTRVEVGDLTFRLRTWGPARAPAVLMLGHMPDVSFSLDPLAAALARSTSPRRILLPERIDLGPDPHFRAIASDIAKLIEALDCGRVDLVGVGFGGTVAIYLATAAPMLVRALALIDAPLPNIHSIDADLSRRLAESYAYVADFLDLDFEAKVADGDDDVLCQFWQRAAWWPEQERRYRNEFAQPDFIARVAAAYRSNFTLIEKGETFTAEDEQRLSPFGRRVDAVRAGAPRKLVSPAITPEPLVLEVPSLHYFSCPQLLPPELSQYEFLSRFVSSPRIVIGNESSLGVHISDPEGVAAAVTQFFADAAERAPLAVEGEPEPARETRDSRYIVEQYDKKIREFRAPSIHSGQTALRGSHPKTHGVVNARFVVAPDLPDDLRVGLFVEPNKSYDSLMRFSSLGKPELEVFADADRDVRGVGLKLLATDADGARITLADFLLNSVPILSTQRGRDVVPQRLDFMDLTRQLVYSDELIVNDVLSVNYFSITPFRYGPSRAVKYVLRPSAHPSLENGASIEQCTDLTGPNFLRHRLEYILGHATSDAVFDFCIQFQRDPVLDPIEDPRVEWHGPLVKVGEVRISRQSVNQPEHTAHDEAIAFNLYHCLPEHAPLGEVNRNRRAVYSSSPVLRRQLNKHATNLYPYHAKRVEVCIVGSGVSGLGAALALTRFGHHVTVVDPRPTLGGHACSIALPDGHSVDPAFGSFTAAAYPNVARLFQELEVEIEELGSFKEALSYFSLDGRRNWKRLEDMPFSRHVLEELERFDAWGILADNNLDFVTARDYFAQHGFSEEFIHYVFLGSIVFVFVGQPANYYLDYPIRQLVQYSYLPVVLAGREPVCRVKHGSASYIVRFAEALAAKGVRFLPSTHANVVERDPAGVTMAFSQDGRRWEERFEQVILSAQPNGALTVLGEHATKVEREILEAIPFTNDTVIIHRDQRFMPARREHWRHANMIVADENEKLDRDRPFLVTKWTKSNLDRETDVFATYAYNRKLDIKGGVPVTFSHVKVTPEVVRLRRRLRAVQGQGRVWLCGSWLRNFTLHEDGLVSGFEAANGIMAGLQEYPVIKPHNIAATKKKAPWGPQHTFLDVLEYQARLHSSKRALVFVDDDCNETQVLTYTDVRRRSRHVAAQLLNKWKVKPGDRVLLVYEPGLDFIVAFLGTIMAGALPVPAYPPNPKELKKDLQRISSIVESCKARVALTSRSYLRVARIGSALSPTSIWQWPKRLTWHTTDDLADGEEVSLPPLPLTQDDTAFLQFTSGSTAEPRGVIISHGNLMHQLALTTEACGLHETSVGCCWVPQYHDLGLVGCILIALYNGASYVSCSPLSFLRNPAIWAEMLHRYRATATAAPDFGYRLLLSRTTAEQRARWDLSRLRVVMSAGEPVHYDTLRDFTQGFAVSGVDARAFCPAYGLAEHVVAVTIGGSRLYHLDKNELTLRHRLRLGDHRVVGCGKPAHNVQVAIVDPSTCGRCGPDDVGEIWVSSPSKARGYYNEPEISKAVFEARIKGNGHDEDNARTWLRTGDLGFMHHGELFITGRLKDLIILRGRNIYPVDIERSAEAASRSLRPGCSALFTDNSQADESLILCAELRKGRYDNGDFANIAVAIRREVMKQEGVHIGTVAFLPARTIPKTTSGKLRRNACRTRWLEGTLKPVYVDNGSTELVQSASYPLPRHSSVASTEDLIHAAICEVTRCDVDRNIPLADQVLLDSVEFLSLVNLLERRLQVRLPVTILNRYPTVVALAEYLRNNTDMALPDAALVTLNGNEESDAAPLFLVHPARGGVECFLELARRLDFPITAIRQTENGSSVEELATRYIAAMKTVSPNGPYTLGGYSFGATICRAMALELERRGENISGLLLLDEIHRPPASLTSSGRGERGGLLFEIAREYLTGADLALLDNALSDHGDNDLDLVLKAIADPASRQAIADQVRRYEHNVRLAVNYDAPPPQAKMVLLRTANAYHRAPEMMTQIHDVPGDHSTMLTAPHVDTLAALVREVLATFDSPEATLSSLGKTTSI